MHVCVRGPEAHFVSYPRAQWALGLILLCAPGVRDKDVPNMGERTSMGSKLYQLVSESPLHANDILSHEEASPLHETQGGTVSMTLGGPLGSIPK